MGWRELLPTLEEARRDGVLGEPLCDRAKAYLRLHLHHLHRALQRSTSVWATIEPAGSTAGRIPSILYVT